MSKKLNIYVLLLLPILAQAQVSHMPSKAAISLQQQQAMARLSATQMQVAEEELLGDGIQPPAKAVKQLATIPKQLLSTGGLVQYAQQLRQQWYSKLSSADKHWIDSITNNIKDYRLHNAAAVEWYKQHPQKALVLQVHAALQHPNEIITWNNLGAMLKMAGFPHKAIPIFQYGLSQMPNSTILLNNIGQAYLTLGDITVAQPYLQKSLVIAPYNPDANHAMGMISLYNNKLEAARSYFEKSLQVAQRANTIANYIKAGGKLDLSELRKKKKQWSGTKASNTFDDLALEQFDIDFFPKKMADVQSYRPKGLNYDQALDDEIKYWTGRTYSGITEVEQKYYRHYNRSVYSEIVDVLMEELGKEFHSNYLALPFEKSDIAIMQQTTKAIASDIETINATVVAPPGSNYIEEQAFQQLRCQKKLDVYDKYLPQYNGIVEKRYKLLKKRWKDYINQLIPILALDPTPGNQKLAFGAMTGFFSMLKGIANQVMLPDLPIDCNVNLTTAEALQILTSKRNLSLNCPDVFKVEKEIFGVNIAVNCDGLKIDAGMEDEPIGVGYEKNFNTGMSTLWFGIGINQAFEFDGKQLGELALSNQFFISFDKHNQFADAGYRGNAAIDGKGDNALNFDYAFAINAGFDAQLETKGVFEGVEDWL
jgi:tetratricopeptide (TPR) repeat protein